MDIRSRRISSDIHPYTPNEKILKLLNLIGCLWYAILLNHPIYLILPIIGYYIGQYSPIVGDICVNIFIWINILKNDH